MPLTRPDLTKMTNDEKLAMIEQIESSIVSGSPDVEEKIELIGDIWDSVDHQAIPTPEWLKEELIRRHEEYLRDPSQAVDWEEAKARILSDHASRNNPS